MDQADKVWLLGADSFTGHYLLQALKDANYEVDTTAVDITDAQQVEQAMLAIQPSYIINLAAISFVPDGDSANIYAVNTIGVQHILDASLELAIAPKKIILVSSSTVYGQAGQEDITEDTLASPVNHYGCSKWAMEQIANTYADQLNIVITRPFNYTGQNQEAKFLVPKIVQHFQQSAAIIELGNIDIWRDFSDVRWVANAYVQLLKTDKKNHSPVNLCSGKLTSIREIISRLEQLTGHIIDIKVNPDFVRASDIKRQKGDNGRLYELLPTLDAPIDFEHTLQWMLESPQNDMAE